VSALASACWPIGHEHAAQFKGQQTRAGPVQDRAGATVAGTDHHNAADVVGDGR